MKINCEQPFFDAIHVLGRQGDKVALLVYNALCDSYTPSSFNNVFPSYIAIEAVDAKDCKNVSYIDIDINNLGFENPYTHKKRRKSKIGRIVKKLFNEKFITDMDITDSDIEKFVNKYASLFAQDNESLEIYDDDKISWAYHADNYNSDYGGGGSLWSSCMRYQEKNDFFSIYENNKECKLIVLLRDDLVIGRALLWDFVDIDTDEKLKVMDRIYTIKDFDRYKFIRWAIAEGYYYKHEQSYTCQQFINPKTGVVEQKKFAIPISYTDHYRYPYMDTFHYLSESSGVLSNNDSYQEDSLRCEDGGTDRKVFDICDDDTLINKDADDTVYVDDRDGHTHIDNTVMSDLEGERFLEEDAIYSNYHDDYIRCGNEIYSDYLSEEIYSPDSVHSKTLSSHIPGEISVYLDYCDDYMPKDLTILSNVDGHIIEEDAVSSKYHDCMILADNAHEIDGDFIHKDHVVYSHYEDKNMIATLSLYIMGTGWVSKEKESEAKENGLPIEADNKTEYEMRLIGNKS